jgi:hypothetical protein
MGIHEHPWHPWASMGMYGHPWASMASMASMGMYGRPLVGKSFFGISAKKSGAVMYAALMRGR